MKPIETPMIERLLNPVSESLNVEAARRLLSVKPDKAVAKRVSQLARRCNEGKLTAAEREEYDRLLAAEGVIAMLKAKSRVLLAKQPE